MELMMMEHQANKIIVLILILASCNQSRDTKRNEIIRNEDTTSSSVKIGTNSVKDVKIINPKINKSLNFIKQDIPIFINEVVKNENTSLNIYDKYFGQTSEIEYIMTKANEDTILHPFFKIKKKNISITLSYISWRFKQVKVKDSNDIKSISEINLNNQDEKIVKIKFKNGETFYFVYNIESDLPRAYIGSIYDKNKITLVPDNNIWTKLEL